MLIPLPPIQMNALLAESAIQLVPFQCIPSIRPKAPLLALAVLELIVPPTPLPPVPILITSPLRLLNFISEAAATLGPVLVHVEVSGKVAVLAAPTVRFAVLAVPVKVGEASGA